MRRASVDRVSARVSSPTLPPGPGRPQCRPPPTPPPAGRGPLAFMPLSSGRTHVRRARARPTPVTDESALRQTAPSCRVRSGCLRLPEPPYEPFSSNSPLPSSAFWNVAAVLLHQSYVIYRALASRKWGAGPPDIAAAGGGPSARTGGAGGRAAGPPSRAVDPGPPLQRPTQGSGDAC